MSKFKIGDLITNGVSAGRVMEIVKHDPEWRTSGVKILNIGLASFGGNVGYTSFVADYLSWHLLPLEWSPVVGGGLEERYVNRPGHGRMVRELRRIEEGSHVN